MIVKLPERKARGRGFKGLAAYLTQPKEGQHRALWATVENMGAVTPETAARLMAYTAKHADELKAAAGVKNTGRKATTGEVYHAIMSWPEGVEPSEAEQQKAARDMLKAIGLDQAQALLVAHNDNGLAHVHLMVNLVNAENGTRWSVDKDRDQARAWADDYAERGGWLHLLPAAAEKRAKRQRGEDTPKASKPADNVSRPTFQKIERAASEDWKRRKAERDGAFARQGAERAELRAVHSAEWKTAKIEAAQHKAAYKAAFRAAYQRHKAADKIANKPRWKALFKEQELNRVRASYALTNASTQAAYAQREARKALAAVNRAERRKGKVLGRLAQRFGLALTPEQARAGQQVAAQRMANAAAALKAAELAKATIAQREEAERKALGSKLSQAAFEKAQADVLNMPRADFAAMIARQNAERAEQIERQNAERAALGMKPYTPHNAGAATVTPLQKMKANEEQAKTGFARAADRRQNRETITPPPVKHAAPTLTMGGRHSGNHAGAPDKAARDRQAEAAALADRSKAIFKPVDLKRERPTDKPLAFEQGGKRIEPQKAQEPTKQAAQPFTPSNDRTGFTLADLKAQRANSGQIEAGKAAADKAAAKRTDENTRKPRGNENDDFGL